MPYGNMHEISDNNKSTTMEFDDSTNENQFGAKNDDKNSFGGNWSKIDGNPSKINLPLRNPHRFPMFRHSHHYNR